LNLNRKWKQALRDSETNIGGVTIIHSEINMRMLALVILVVMGGIGIGLQFWSFFHLSENEDVNVFDVIAKGPFASKKYFTEIGWKYRIFGIFLTLTGVACPLSSLSSVFGDLRTRIFDSRSI
jgi:hypothetical protein